MMDDYLVPGFLYASGSKSIKITGVHFAYNLIRGSNAVLSFFEIVFLTMRLKALIHVFRTHVILENNSFFSNYAHDWILAINSPTGVEIRNNKFEDSAAFRSIVYIDGSLEHTVVNNNEFINCFANEAIFDYNVEAEPIMENDLNLPGDYLEINNLHIEDCYANKILSVESVNLAVLSNLTIVWNDFTMKTINDEILLDFFLTGNNPFIVSVTSPSKISNVIYFSNILDVQIYNISISSIKTAEALEIIRCDASSILKFNITLAYFYDIKYSSDVNSSLITIKDNL